MADIVIRNDNFLPAQAREELERRYQEMDFVKNLATLSYDELSKVYLRGEFEVARAVLAVRTIREGLGTTSPAEQAAAGFRETLFLSNMSQISQQAGERMLDIIRLSRMPERTWKHRVSDWFESL